MCARITLTTTAAEVADLFGLSFDLSRERRKYNVVPSSTIPVVRVANGRREAAHLTWGLIPHWAKSARPGGFVNARVETVAEKPAFRDPLRLRRCLVPAAGFFEWKTVGKRKRPYFFRRAGGGPWAYAALWDRWDGPDGPVETVAVLTVPANELVRPFHDRMPAVVPEEHFAAWLDPSETRPGKVLPLLIPYPAGRMECWAVSDRVNSAAADDAELLRPVPEPAQPTWTQPSLFDAA